MSKKGKLYIGLFILVIISIVVLELNKPKQVNWFPSYATHHKIPFGSYVFNDQIQNLAKDVIAVDRPPYEYLRDNASIKGTYFFYNNGISFGEEELNALLDWTRDGNTLFIASSDFEYNILDTLNLDTRVISTLNNFDRDYNVKLVNPKLDKGDTYGFDKATSLFYFNKVDTANTRVIGTIKAALDDNDEEPLINVVKQPYGKGEIVLSTFPQALTNYFILNNPNQDYVAGLLSYIDMDSPIYLDNHYKSGKVFYTSPMYLFLNTKELKWAYYIVLIGALIYIIFEGKRKQRAIPIIKPLKNQTVEFTRTIANMYYERGKHKELAEHKIQHFLEYVRTQLHLRTSEIDQSFIKNLAARSNNTIEDTKKLLETIHSYNNKSSINKIELERLNTLIENFKSRNQWKMKS